jgi:hypothetical protein
MTYEFRSLPDCQQGKSALFLCAGSLRTAQTNAPLNIRGIFISRCQFSKASRHRQEQDVVRTLGHHLCESASDYRIPDIDMTTHHLFDESINEFGRFIGLSGLYFDQDDICPLIAGDVRVLICRDVENGRLKLYTILDDQMPSPPSPSWIRHAPSIGMEPDGDRLVAFFTLSIDQLKPVAIAECVDSLIECHLKWSLRNEPNPTRDLKPAAFHARA